MAEQKAAVFVELSEGRKKLMLTAAMLMSCAYMVAAYANGTAVATQLQAINGYHLFPAASALQPMGMMITISMAGKLGDTMGRKPVAIAGIILHMIFQLMLGFLTNPIMFVGAYTMVGVAAGLYLSLSYAFISDVSLPMERSKYFGYLATFNAIGCLAGPFVAGRLMQAGLTAASFYFYIPVSLISLVIILTVYPNKKANLSAGAKFDFLGLGYLVMSIAGIVLWLSLGGNYFGRFDIVGILLLAAMALFGVLLVRRELNIANPAVPLAIFRKKRFTVAFLCQFFYGAYATCALAYTIVHAIFTMGIDPGIASYVTMPQTIVQAVTGMFIGKWMAQKFAPRIRITALLAFGCTSVGLLIFGMTKAASPFSLLCVATAIGGFGYACGQTCLTPFFQTELEPREFGAAQGMFMFASSGASCIFSAIAAALLGAGLSYNTVFFAGLAFTMAAFVIALVGFKIPEAREQ